MIIDFDINAIPKMCLALFLTRETSLIKSNTQDKWPSSMVEITNGQAQCSSPLMVELNA